MSPATMKADELVTSLTIAIERSSTLIRIVEHDMDNIVKYCEISSGPAETTIKDVRNVIGIIVEILEAGEDCFKEWETIWKQFQTEPLEA